MMVLLAALTMAFFNRLRGGLFGDKIRRTLPFFGTTLGRASFGLAAGGLALALGQGIVLAGAVAGTAFLGYAIAPFSPFQSMMEKHDMFVMSLRGLMLTGTTGIAIATLANPVMGFVFALSGLVMGPLYYVAIHHLPLVPLFNDNPATRDKNDTAEVLHGLFYGAMLAITLM